MSQRSWEVIILVSASMCVIGSIVWPIVLPALTICALVALGLIHIYLEQRSR
jgi:hypothetical protein